MALLKLIQNHNPVTLIDGAGRVNKCLLCDGIHVINQNVYLR